MKDPNFSNMDLLVLSAVVRHELQAREITAGRPNTVATPGDIRDLRCLERLVEMIEASLTRRGFNQADDRLRGADIMQKDARCAKHLKNMWRGDLDATPEEKENLEDQ